MTAIGFDTASAITRAVLADAKAKGAAFVMLYLKWATPELVTMIHSCGLAVGLIWETTAERALGGLKPGLADGDAALAKALALGNPPAAVAVWFTVDFDATAEQQPAVLAYITGAGAGLAGRLADGVYANGAIDAACRAAKLAAYTWVAGGRGMRGTVAFLESGAADVTQDVGDRQHLGLPISVDTDAAADPKLPWAWWPTAA